MEQLLLSRRRRAHSEVPISVVLLTPYGDFSNEDEGGKREAAFQERQ